MECSMPRLLVDIGACAYEDLGKIARVLLLQYIDRLPLLEDEQSVEFLRCRLPCRAFANILPRELE